MMTSLVADVTPHLKSIKISSMFWKRKKFATKWCTKLCI